MLALMLLVACAGKLCGDPYLAELSAHRGDVQRDEARATGQWSQAARGDRFHVGDGLRTGASGSAELALSSDGVARVEANTLLRFLDRDPRAGGRRLALEQGVVRIQSGRVELDVHTPRALARIQENSTVRIVAGERDLRFDVLVGRVSIEQDGGTRELLAGEQRTLSRPAQKEAGVPATPTADAAAVAPTSPPSSAPLPEVSLPTLETMTLHAPALPLEAEIAAPPCEAGAQLELGGRRIEPSERGGFVVSLQAGSHDFRVRCGRRVLSRGTLRVRRDLATMELPKSAQKLELEADGRRYTVRYQNLLPAVTVRWPGARPAARYTLKLRRGKRERSFESARPERPLKPADLSEGEQEFWFESASGQRSEVSTLRLEFDNTARSLSLSEPSEGAPAPGDTATVSGVALLRSQVSANGVPLTLDSKGRFRAQVRLSSARSLVIRAVHGAAGVHYYVRRLR